jgi:hypothetical protein
MRCFTPKIMVFHEVKAWQTMRKREGDSTEFCNTKIL